MGATSMKQQAVRDCDKLRRVHEPVGEKHKKLVAVILTISQPG